ncbi:MAG: homoserine dehydrogenase [Bacilli bacterium]
MNNIALFGYGTVGKGVRELIDRNPLFHLISVFDRKEKEKELGSLLITSIDEIINDKEVDTVVECLGGDSLSYEVIKKALKNGKNVVTSNKETVSIHLKEYLSLAEEYRVSFEFEASVGGGIPLIYPLSIQKDFDEIYEIKGILNGTSNFILSKMQDEGMNKEDAILLAQKKGFAEKDPTADLEGLDMVRKGNILASIVSKKEIDNIDIPHFGISNINQQIIKEILRLGKTIKLVTDIKFQNDGLSIVICPFAISPENPLSTIKNEYNGVMIDGEYQEPLTFIGKGAGKNPTASAILQDLIRIEKKIPYPYQKITEKIKVKPDLKGTYLLFKADTLKAVNNPTFKQLKDADFICKME